ncbi:MAG: DUF6265 family protein [Bacteroidota bacterium]
MKTHLFLALMMTVTLSAQKTLQLEPNQKSPEASLDQVSWLAGHWKGEAFGGVTEELWSPPMGGSMMFVFKLVNDDAVTFYEAGHIQQVDNTLILQLKHFHGDLKGWETQDETVDFKLVKIEQNRFYFEGFTLEKVSSKEIKMYVLIGNENKKEEVTFAYHRVETESQPSK